MSDDALAAAGLALEQAYEDVQRTRMQGLPIVNPALRVELVGLRAWDGLGVGVLVTPWCMNLVALPLERTWPATRVGTSQLLVLPSGSYDVLAADMPGAGPHLLGSLVSPMQDFGSQGDAVDAARAAMDLLFEAPEAPETPATPALAEPAAADAGRRGFLLGRAPR